jgi:hypothetical protein
MHNWGYFLLLALVSFFSCEHSQPRPDDALGTGRLFIRSILDGKLKTAEELLYQDSSNILSFEEFEKYYQDKMTEKEKQDYKKSDIIIHEVQNVNDSVIILYYSGSLQKQKKPLRIIQKNNLWQIDFHYTISGNL